MPSGTKVLANHVRLHMPSSIHSGKRNWEPLAQHDDMARGAAATGAARAGNVYTPNIKSVPLEHEADGDVGCLRALVIGVYYRFNIGGYKNRRDIHKSKKVCADMLSKVDVKINKTEGRVSVLESLLTKQIKNKNRRQAKKYLQQLKRAQKSLAGFMSYKSELDTMLISLDQTEDQTDFVTSFKAARKALNGHAKTLPIADFDDFVDDMEETKADLDDFHNTLAQRQEVSYADIESELDAMFGLETGAGGGGPSDDAEQMLAVASLPTAPVNPIYTAKQLKNRAEEQLRVLEEATI